MVWDLLVDNFIDLACLTSRLSIPYDLGLLVVRPYNLGGTSAEDLACLSLPFVAVAHTADVFF